MAEDKDKPSANHLKGSVKEAIGKLTGDTRIAEEGQREKQGSKSSPGKADRGA